MSVSYGLTTVLNNLSWTIEPDENYVLAGKSGSGKTTLGKKLTSIPNTFVIDTDEIDDSNALEILSDKKYKHFFLLKQNLIFSHEHFFKLIYAYEVKICPNKTMPVTLSVF